MRCKVVEWRANGFLRDQEMKLRPSFGYYWRTFFSIDQQRVVQGGHWKYATVFPLVLV